MRYFRSLMKRLFARPYRNSRRTLNRIPGRAAEVDILESRLVLSAFSFGSTAFDGVEAMAADDSGNVYVAGRAYGAVDIDPGPGVVSLPSGGGVYEDGFIGKFDSTGHLLWSGGMLDSQIYGMTIDSNGALYVTGTFRGTVDFDFGAGVSTMTAGNSNSSTNATTFVAKYNPDGSLATKFQIGNATSTTFGSAGQAIRLDSVGNIYLSGQFSRGNMDMDPGSGTFMLNNASGNTDAFFVKFNSAGNFIWAKDFSNDPTIAAGVWAPEIEVDANQNVYVVGSFVGTVDFDPGAGVVNKSTGGTSGDGYLAKLNSDGTLNYVNTIATLSAPDDAFGLELDNAGNAYVTGGIYGSATITATNGSSVLSSPGQYDAAILKFTSAGALTWARRIGGTTSFDAAYDVLLDGQGSVYVAGHFSGTVDFDPNAGTQNRTGAGGFADTFLLKLTEAGNFLDVWTLGGTDVDYGWYLDWSSPGTLALAGRFAASGDFEVGSSVTTLTSAGDQDCFVSVVNIGAPNAVPVASDSQVNVAEDGSVSSTMIASDPESQPLLYSLVSTANAHGAVVITNAATGAFVYRPAQNYFGPASFTFKVSDGLADSNIATVSILVAAVEDKPVATSRTISHVEDRVLDSSLTASDADGDLLTYRLLDTSNLHGTITLGLQSPNSFRYQPDPNFKGLASFTFVANDGKSDSNVATFTIDVLNSYDPPGARDVNLTINEDQSASGNLDGFAIDGQSFTYQLVSAVNANGSVTLTNSTLGIFQFVPNQNFNGSGSFTYRTFDGQTFSNTATVSITVLPVNDAPTANVGSLSTNEDSTATGTLTGSDIDSSTISFAVEDTSSAHGTVLITNPATGDYSYTPDVNFYGNASFTFVANDGEANSVASTISITVFPVNDAPIANTGSYSTNEDTPLVGMISAVDIDNDAISFYITNTMNSHGELIITDAETGAFRYVPDPNFSGQASFTFVATDTMSNSDPATITIDVVAVNDAPVAYHGSLSTTEDAAGAGTLTGSDLDNAAISFALVDTSNAHGTVTITDSVSGAYTYQPDPDFFGTANFTYIANDGSLNSAPATISLTVFPVNDAPVANPGSLSTDEDTAVSGMLSGSDIDSSYITFYFVETTNAHGSLTITNFDTGAYTYVPDPNFNGTAEFKYVATDLNASSTPVTVSITVNAVDDAPLAYPALLSTDEDTSVSGTLVGSDIDSAALTFAVADTSNAHGAVTITNASTGAFTYTPALDYFGTATFTFVSNDGVANSTPATISLTIFAVNDAPVANPGTLVTNEDTAASGFMSGSDIDSPAISFYFVETDNAHGTLTITNSNTGAYTYVPDPNFNGTASFKYAATDLSANSNPVTVTITVNAVNDPPTLSNSSSTIPENSPAGTLVSTATGFDQEGSALSYSITGGNAAGAFAIDSVTGRITVANSVSLDFETTPVFNLTVRATDTAGAFGSAIFTVQLTDGSEQVPPTMDIDPGDCTNTINIRSNGKIDIVIFGTVSFDVSTINVSTLRFGRTGTEDSITRKKNAPKVTYRDVNGDGRLDLVATCDVSKMGFRVGDTVGILTGRRLDGSLFTIQDRVKIINSK